MSDPHEEGPVCDFCKIVVEPDETLEPIYVGEQPKPKKHYLKGIAQRGGMHDNRYKGKYDAIRKALHDCTDVDLRESNVVHDVRAVGGDVHFVTENELRHTPNPTDYELERQRDKVAAEIIIEPQQVPDNPDAMVCDCCAEMFRSM
jgi:hypothetical protein